MHSVDVWTECFKEDYGWFKGIDEVTVVSVLNYICSHSADTRCLSVTQLWSRWTECSLRDTDKMFLSHPSVIYVFFLLMSELQKLLVRQIASPSSQLSPVSVEQCSLSCINQKTPHSNILSFKLHHQSSSICERWVVVEMSVLKMLLSTFELLYRLF